MRALNAFPRARTTSGLALLVLGVLLSACETTPVTPDGPVSARERAQLQTQLGVGYLREGNRELAYQRLKQATEADPSYAQAHNALALLQEQLGQDAEAEAGYRRAIALDPTFSAAHTNLGSFLCRRDRFAEADAEFRRALANPLYGSPEVAQTNAGLCLQRKGDLDAAADHLRRALSRNARIAPALVAMSEISLEEGNSLSARGYLQRYLEVGQNTPRTLWLGIRIERTLGDKNAVSSYSMLLKSKYPDAPETKLLRNLESQ